MTKILGPACDETAVLDVLDLQVAVLRLMRVVYCGISRSCDDHASQVSKSVSVASSVMIEDLTDYRRRRVASTVCRSAVSLQMSSRDTML